MSLEMARMAGAHLLVNTQSNRAAVQVSVMHDDGRVEARTPLIRPVNRETVSLDEFARSHWRPAPRRRVAALWEAECAKVP
jgi:hypothetical protein